MKNRSIALDALRGIAALCVVVYHAREINWIGVSHIWHVQGLSLDFNAFLSYLSAPFVFGFTAVPLFFVISGYCIHRPNIAKLQADPNHRLNLVEYFKRRLWRIYPVLLAALLLTLAFDSYTRAHFPHDYKLGNNSWPIFLINLVSLQKIAGPTYGTNIPLWTLGMELHFYAFYPLLFWFSKKFGPLKTLLGVLFLSLVSIVGLRLLHSNQLIFLPFWFTWTTGFFIAECEAGRYSISLRKWKAAIVVSLLAACALALKKDIDLAEPLFAVFFGALLLWSLDSKNNAFWEKTWGRLMARVGIFSYSLYAIHVPFLIFLRSALQGGVKSNYVIVPFVFTLLSILLALVVFWLVERWSLRLPTRRDARAIPDASIVSTQNSSG